MNLQQRFGLFHSRPDWRAARRPRRGWQIVAVGIAIAYSPMWLPRIPGAAGIAPGLPGPASSIFWNALAVGGLAVYVAAVERRRPASIGMRKPQGKDLEWALYLFGVYMAWQWLIRAVLPPTADTGTAVIAALPVTAVLGMIVSAAVFEEILYRGYPIERLSELTGRRWLAYALTVPLFIAPHIFFFGVQWLWTAGVGAVVIYVLYAKTQNLPACMLLHLGINLPILIPTIAAHVGG
ncbi:CPBP family intramembrane metalloprotease [Arthrobacter sp. zg-Y859]|uniref:CPBP family intramembrane metalloprotease n=1 Tax=Arthrobacter jinronghuae TaxID=2964609 RepID=A0ABT1NN67_9MICC|nr:type II CAAX endopeptidase family protein [Arthrobacter jinronghuae]MCQ1949095.1 CPBP family intramembrane metalloprotease [Arthrobacter jinronghuae]MCQ1955462.1 CPBP family intramembrane metalloprotease [Arthrobacter jinronghuae]